MHSIEKKNELYIQRADGYMHEQFMISICFDELKKKKKLCALFSVFCHNNDLFIIID